jgi:hypothetical protein
MLPQSPACVWVDVYTGIGQTTDARTQHAL